MNVDVLIAEIGSTTTVVNAFNIGENPAFLGQGQAPTSVNLGDVNIGLKAAISSLENTLKVSSLTWNDLLATSSAAGGLRMSVHGLVYDMTVRAATEAALGAGAIIKNITSGKLTKSDVAKVVTLSPNIILVAGGVDYGERDTALHNFELLAKSCPKIPIIYAGNIQNQDDIRFIANEFNTKVYIVDNVYPQVDCLNIEPTRRIIHDAFEEHITNAAGMAAVRTLVNGPIIPTPGAVMQAAQLLYNEIGDLIVFDVGGATTDLHSVTNGSAEINSILLSPEPIAKRTVEGDLGVYVNMQNIVERIGISNIQEIFPNANDLIANAKPIPQTIEEIRFVEYLTSEAVRTALFRHAGTLKDFYGPTGKKTIAQGKDLTAIKYIIGTGGALTRLPNRIKILESILSSGKSTMLYPVVGTKILIDNQYIMASLGVMSKRYPEVALKLLMNSCDITYQ